jgi:FKBP-type peptidyl-prolyl cis-trans isomerase FklB
VISSPFCAAACPGRRLRVAAAAALTVILTVTAVQVHARQSTAPSASHRSAASHGASSAPGGAGDVKAQGSYSIGVAMGIQLLRSGIRANDVSFEKLMQGMRDVTGGKVQPSIEDQQHIQALVQQIRARAAETNRAAALTNRAAARKFLAENARRQGVKSTPSGLQYRVLKEGTGPSPRPTDQVTVNYSGTLLNGTEFDNSYKRGHPETFTVNGVIKGWSEALVMMKPGAKWQLYIPPDLAYGDEGKGPVPPGALLKFDVELVSVTPAASPGGARPDIGAGGGGR